MTASSLSRSLSLSLFLSLSLSPFFSLFFSLSLYCSQITLMDMDLAGIHIHWCLYRVTLTAMDSRL